MTDHAIFNRRTFLKAAAAAGATASLPILPSMGGAAETGDFPTRLVIFFTPGGTQPSRWWPSGSETNWTIDNDSILAPLKPHKNDLMVLEGIDMESSYHGPGDGHRQGMGHVLTGIELQKGNFSGSGFADGISVDQHIANQISGNQRFDSLTLGNQCKRATGWTRMCFSGPGQPVNPTDDPYDAFDNLFADLDKDPLGLQKIRDRRTSVLDYVNDRFKKIDHKVSSRDKQRVEAHFSSIRDIERRLNSGNQPGAACSPPALGDKIDTHRDSNFPKIGRLMTDTLVSALSCNLTRVATFQWSKSVSRIHHEWVDSYQQHHDASHHGNNNQQEIDEVTRISNWYVKRFAYLLEKMKSVPEGNGTLLDHSIVVWVSDMAKGNSHTRRNMPFIIAGSGNGQFQTGRYIKYNGQPHNNLLVSLCQAMGVQTNTFGNPAYCTGALPKLTG